MRRKKSLGWNQRNERVDENVTLLLAFLFLVLVGFTIRTGGAHEMRTVKELEGDVTIGVLSDTHIPTRASRVPDEVLQEFRQEDVDLILHAGDLVSLDVKETLEEVAPTVAVCGNMDPSGICEELPERVVVEAGDVRVGAVHNTVNPLSNRMRMLARENDLDLLVFGHTHRSKLTRDGERYYLNPGSPTQPIMDSRSFAMVRIEDGEVEPKIINMES